MKELLGQFLQTLLVCDFHLGKIRHAKTELLIGTLGLFGFLLLFFLTRFVELGPEKYKGIGFRFFFELFDGFFTGLQLFLVIPAPEAIKHLVEPVEVFLTLAEDSLKAVLKEPAIQPVTPLSDIKSLPGILRPQHKLSFPTIKSKVDQALLKGLVYGFQSGIKKSELSVNGHQEFLNRSVLYKLDIILVLQDAANGVFDNLVGDVIFV